MVKRERPSIDQSQFECHKFLLLLQLTKLKDAYKYDIYNGCEVTIKLTHRVNLMTILTRC